MIRSGQSPYPLN